MTQQQFINTLYPAALEVEKKYGLPALAVVAQSALETGWGKHAPGNMYFGIKAGSSWTGQKQLLWTHEYVNGVKVRVQAWFRKYNSALESLSDYAKLIRNNKRYAEALKYPNDPVKYITEIRKAGYATDPNYVSKIVSNMEIIKKKSPTQSKP